MKRWLFEFFRADFERFLVEDMLLDIPDKISEPVIKMIGAKRDAMMKWIYFEANSILARPPLSHVSAERRNGQLIILQALLLATRGAKSDIEELADGKEVVKSIPSPVDYRADVDFFRKEAAKRKSIPQG